MGLMNKMKSGFSEAGNKAKLAMEINKLKSQNSGKQKEIDKHYLEIGRVVYLVAVDRVPDQMNTDYQSRIEDITRLEDEIAANKKQIKTLSGEKDCECGQSVPIESLFCSACGRTFPAGE